ncbi:Uncharacterized protein involved in cation transport [Raoultella planticola]|uniref:glutathione-specific gamma-glutamylcyclotransferase n=1 Tax=Raoultella planticola TaxID=575 RepID=A0A485ATC1_RAOPL|nr:Uncharacterized protein involved in cation transport [Raoultella planticola]
MRIVRRRLVLLRNRFSGRQSNGPLPWRQRWPVVRMPGSVWIFGYGSLMWNPALEYRETCTGTLPGWHRAFCLRLTAGRGSACQPGRMLALKEGGRTTGGGLSTP